MLSSDRSCFRLSQYFRPPLKLTNLKSQRSFRTPTLRELRWPIEKMHEYLLFGQVSPEEHRNVVQQLAGVTRMQPRYVVELRLVFKAQPPSGLSQIPSGGGSQEVVAPELQRTRAFLGTSLFYVQLIGEVPQTIGLDSTSPADATSIASPNHDPSPRRERNKIGSFKPPKTKWRLEFRDIPDAGKLSVSTRLMSRTPIEHGDAFSFLQALGYE